MSVEQKEETIHSLQVTLQRSQNLELILRFRIDDKNVKEIEKKNKKLSKQIDKLIVEAMQNWLLDAQDVAKEIKKANTNLQRAITSVKNRKKEAESIVKALGFVDDVLSIATSLLAV